MKLLDRLVGSAADHTVNQRILNATILFTAIFMLYGWVGGILVGQPASILIPIAINICVFFGIYFVSKTGKWRKAIRPIYITFGLLSICLFYFYLNGINGEVPLYFILGATLSVTVVKKRYYTFIISLWTLSFLACRYLEVTYPEMVSTDEANAVRSVEFLISSIGILLLITSIIVLFKNLLENEKRHLQEANRDLHKAAKDLELAKEEAEKANKAKSEFLSVMSHEIRTPLNAVIGMSYILRHEDPRPDQLENLKVLKFSSENLLSLINDVLDYNKIEVGKLIMEDAPFSINELLESVMSAFQMKAEEKRIKLELVKTPEVKNKTVTGDATRLTQVLNNLVSNAVKFTEEGKVKLSAELEDMTDDEAIVRFTVEDTGIGIPEDFKDKIFDSFMQANAAISRKYGGTGLGLAISRELVRLMGGELELHSEVGKGSQFSFELPLPLTDMTARASAKADDMTAAPLSGVKILVAEDNAVNGLVAKKFLNGWGATMEIAKDGEEAIKMWSQGDFDLILMDLRMPVMDGMEATKKIRSSGDPKAQIPILALTASALMEEENEIFQIGMNEYISKPFNPEELLSKVMKYTEGVSHA